MGRNGQKMRRLKNEKASFLDNFVTLWRETNHVRLSIEIIHSIVQTSVFLFFSFLESFS